MSYSDAQNRATAKYNKKTYDRIEIVVPKGTKALIREFAQSHGKSVNQLFNELIMREMQKEDAE